MSANLNKVLLAGRVSIPPVLKSATNGLTICNFGIAINRRYRTPDGAQHEDTDFLDLTTFGKTADQCATYLKKGNPVFLEARLHQETWVDKNTGQNRNRLGLVAERVHFLGGTPGADSGQVAVAPEIRQALRPLTPPQYNAAITASQPSQVPEVPEAPAAAPPPMAAPQDPTTAQIQPIPAEPDFGDVPF